jgi:hypothetical protein
MQILAGLAEHLFRLDRFLDRSNDSNSPIENSIPTVTSIR